MLDNTRDAQHPITFKHNAIKKINFLLIFYSFDKLLSKLRFEKVARIKKAKEKMPEGYPAVKMSTGSQKLGLVNYDKC